MKIVLFFSQNDNMDYSVGKLVKILKLQPDNTRICSERVIRCQENAAFVINARCLTNYNDYRYDDNGWFRNHGYKTYLVIFKENGGAVTDVKRIENKEADINYNC